MTKVGLLIAIIVTCIMLEGRELRKNELYYMYIQRKISQAVQEGGKPSVKPSIKWGFNV